MVEPWRLRTVGPSKAASMALLWVQAEAHRQGKAIPATVAPKVVERQAERLSRPRVVAVMAFVGPVPVAGCHAEPATRPDDSASATTAHLSGVSVHPDWWGRGIAAAMIGLVLDHLRTDGFSDAQLWVLESNARARRLYERTGWELIRLGALHRDGPHAVYRVALHGSAAPTAAE